MIIVSGFVLSESTFQFWKSLAEIASFGVGMLAAIGALLTYRSNSQRERAKWAVQLYEKFYEGDRYKEMRDRLDCTSDAADVQKLVSQEPSIFTDYLNFFELVTFLAETKQLSKDDVLRLFQYYLHCLKRHKVVMKYINNKDKGFEQLSEFFNKTEL